VVHKLVMDFDKLVMDFDKLVMDVKKLCFVLIYDDIYF
jgi:hypothetical protein